MATRAELRATLRVRLEDSTTNPLYTDAELNDFIGQAIRQYGRWAPLTALVTASAVAGVTQVALPVGVPEWGVVRLRDNQGADVAVMNGREGFGPSRMVYHAQAWRVWGGQIILQRAVSTSEAGNWTIDYLDERPMPTSDVGDCSIEAGDEPVVIQLAYALALDRRQVEDYKRGAKSASPNLPKDARDEAYAMFSRSRRRAVGGWLGVA